MSRGSDSDLPCRGFRQSFILGDLRPELPYLERTHDVDLTMQYPKTLVNSQCFKRTPYQENSSMTHC